MLGKIPEEMDGRALLVRDTEQNSHDRQGEEHGDPEVLQGRCLMILSWVS